MHHSPHSYSTLLLFAQAPAEHRVPSRIHVRTRRTTVGPNTEAVENHEGRWNKLPSSPFTQVESCGCASIVRSSYSKNTKNVDCRPHRRGKCCRYPQDAHEPGTCPTLPPHRETFVGDATCHFGRYAVIVAFRTAADDRTGVCKSPMSDSDCPSAKLPVQPSTPSYHGLAIASSAASWCCTTLGNLRANKGASRQRRARLEKVRQKLLHSVSVKCYSKWQYRPGSHTSNQRVHDSASTLFQQMPSLRPHPRFIVRKGSSGTAALLVNQTKNLVEV